MNHDLSPKGIPSDSAGLENALAHDQVYINGGQRGLQARLRPADARDALKAIVADVVS